LLSPTASPVGEHYKKFEKYQQFLSLSLGKVKAVNGCYTSQVKMTLNEFVEARNIYCRLKHSNDCMDCKKIISAANLILTEKVVLLKSVYQKSFMKQGSRYKTDKAVERLMQL